ncbi:hypothetical protein, partial [Vreelandella venusta]|uniref:hypothetical protein n=1 Tax=Vreelandella venusta TaxID=44935 RepID=UPI003F6707BD
PLSADGSVGSPHARVGHRQALIEQRTQPTGWVFCLRGRKKHFLAPVTKRPHRTSSPSHHTVIPEWGDRESTLACSSPEPQPNMDSR